MKKIPDYYYLSEQLRETEEGGVPIILGRLLAVGVLLVGDDQVYVPDNPVYGLPFLLGSILTRLRQEGLEEVPFTLLRGPN